MIQSEKQIKLIVDGEDAEVLADLLEFARRYMKDCQHPKGHPLKLDEFNAKEFEYFRIKLDAFFEVLR